MSNSVKMPGGSANEFLTALQSIIGGGSEVVDDILWLNVSHDAGIYDNYKSSTHILSLRTADGRLNTLDLGNLSSSYTITCIYDKSKSGNAVMFDFNTNNTGLYSNNGVIVATVGDKIAVWSISTSWINQYYIYNAKSARLSAINSGQTTAASYSLHPVFINAFSDDIGEVVPDVYELYISPNSRTSLVNTKWQVGDKTVVLGSGIGIAID